jgi:hypothetical protein
MARLPKESLSYVKLCIMLLIFNIISISELRIFINIPEHDLAYCLLCDFKSLYKIASMLPKIISNANRTPPERTRYTTLDRIHPDLHQANAQLLSAQFFLQVQFRRQL